MAPAPQPPGIYACRARDGVKVGRELETTVPPDLRYDISVEGDEALVPLHVREQLFLILREGVRNAISHFEAGCIDVEVRISSERVVGYVQDDGQGFVEGDGYAGGGMRSMKERGARGGHLRSDLRSGSRNHDQGFYPIEKGDRQRDLELPAVANPSRRGTAPF